MMGYPEVVGHSNQIFDKLNFLHSQKVAMQKHPACALVPTHTNLVCGHS